MAYVISCSSVTDDGLYVRVTYYDNWRPHWRRGQVVVAQPNSRWWPATWIVKAKKMGDDWDKHHDREEKNETYDLWRCGPTSEECYLTRNCDTNTRRAKERACRS